MQLLPEGWGANTDFLLLSHSHEAMPNFNLNNQGLGIKLPTCVQKLLPGYQTSHLGAKLPT
jgi:hypothetical protein